MRNKDILKEIEKKERKEEKGLGFFEKYLTIWVTLFMVSGVAIGRFFPTFPEILNRFGYANVSILVAVLIWIMIYPMMLKIDFSSIVNATKKPKGLTVTIVTNWLIKPFTMYLIAFFFLKIVFGRLISTSLATEYLAGAVLLGAAPCTAMVFVWSHLCKGDAAYTLVQVAVNDIIILFAFAPIVAFLLGVSDVFVPYNTLFLSVVLFVVIPFASGYISRVLIIKKKGLNYFENVFLEKFRYVTIIGLLLTLIIIFSFQGDIILNNPLHIALIAVPLVIQTFFIFVVAYGWGKLWKIPYCIAAPAAMIGASNFFELSVAVAIALFGLQSGATLATVVGVLVEVPVMLMLVGVARRTKHLFVRA